MAFFHCLSLCRKNGISHAKHGEEKKRTELDSIFKGVWAQLMFYFPLNYSRLVCVDWLCYDMFGLVTLIYHYPSIPFGLPVRQETANKTRQATRHFFSMGTREIRINVWQVLSFLQIFALSNFYALRKNYQLDWCGHEKDFCHFVHCQEKWNDISQWKSSKSISMKMFRQQILLFANMVMWHAYSPDFTTFKFQSWFLMECICIYIMPDFNSCRAG